jgi:hypothetical protein
MSAVDEEGTMRFSWILALCAAAALVGGAPRLSAANITSPTAVDDHHDTDKAYKDGYKHGKDDAKDHKSAYPKSDKWKHSDERRAYEQGYQEGYNSVAGAAAPEALPQSGAVAASPNSPHDIGYQDGLLDGRNDRDSGHSFRPTDTDNYKHADRGYNDSFGSKDSWKSAYRQGYADGYREGYKKH